MMRLAVPPEGWIPPPLASRPSLCANCAAALSKSRTPMMIWSMAVSMVFSPGFYVTVGTPLVGVRVPRDACVGEADTHKGRPYCYIVLSPRAGKFSDLAPVGCAGGPGTFEEFENKFATLPHYEQHTGVENRRVGTTEDTDEQRQGEGADGCAAEERQRAQGEEHGQRRIERASHRLHQAGIHHLLKGLRG